MIPLDRVSDTNILEESAQTIDFNLRALRALGLEKGPEYAILMQGAKQNALAYKTALNVESELSKVINQAQTQNGGAAFDRRNANSILPNVLSQYTSRDLNVGDEAHLSGHEEHFKDLALAQILKSFI